MAGTLDVCERLVFAFGSMGLDVLANRARPAVAVVHKLSFIFRGSQHVLKYVLRSVDEVHRHCITQNGQEVNSTNMSHRWMVRCL